MGAEELRSLFLFDGLSDAQIDALFDASEVVAFADGDELFREGDPADAWWVLLEGRIELRRRTGHEQVVAGALERPGVWAGGFRAWADTASYLGTGRATGPGRVLRVPAAELGALVRAWFPFGVHLIEGFFQTVRSMEALSRQRDSLVALGTLAAGLAHEINNPAAAAARAADALQDSCNAVLASLVVLAERSLSSSEFVALDALRRELDPSSAPTGSLAVADREEALLDWLDDHGVEDSWRIAPPLATAGAEIGWCEGVADTLGEATLGPGLDWVASTVATAGLLAEVAESTERVSGLVAAVKSYSQLDRASTQIIDVTEGLDSTLVVLGSKIAPGITVERSYDPAVPTFEAHPGELNQVWTNLIDNALDAMAGAGTLRLTNRVEDGLVVVDIADTGPGMPPEVVARAFEPFFTTKDVGRGTGLGLDISRRIVVERHRGEIVIDSARGSSP